PLRAPDRRHAPLHGPVGYLHPRPRTGGRSRLHRRRHGHRAHPPHAPALASAPTHPLRLLHAGDGRAPPLYHEELLQLARTNPAFTLDHVESRTLLREVCRRWIESDTDRTRHFFICGVGLIVPTLRDSCGRQATRGAPC